MAQKLNPITNTITNTKDNKMAKPIDPANPGDNSEDNEFEIVDANSVNFAKRGRKSNTDPNLVEFLKTMPKGNTVAIRKMTLDPKAVNYKIDKARVSSQIRVACEQANLDTYRIRWSTDGVPFVEA
jgi:hypothetical protein